MQTRAATEPPTFSLVDVTSTPPFCLPPLRGKSINKGAQAAGIIPALRGLSRNLSDVSTHASVMSGQRQMSVHQEPPQAVVFRKGATDVAFLILGQS